MKIKEINETPIEDRPAIKYKKADNLQGKMKPVAWHATLSSNANKILANGSRKSFSLTGNYEEAVYYAFQRAGSSKRDATVLAVDTSYIENKHTGGMYSTSGTPAYFEVTHPLPPEAFSIADTLSYKDVIKKEQTNAKKAIRQIAKQLPFELTVKGIDLHIDATPMKVKNYMLNNGWTLKDQHVTSWQNRNITTYTLTMDAQIIHITRHWKLPLTELSYDIKF